MCKHASEKQIKPQSSKMWVFNKGIFKMCMFLIELLVLGIQTMADSQSGVEDSKIVGGFEIDLHHAPFLASVQFDGNHICGGGILTLSHVITGCHCLGEVDLGMSHEDIRARPVLNLSVVAGTENIAMPTDEMQRRAIFDIKIHPKCTYDRILLYDFALAFLVKPLLKSVKVKPLTLVSLEKGVFERETMALVGDLDRHCYVAGWGSTEIEPLGGSHHANPILKAARMIAVTDEYCREKLGQMNYKYAHFDFKANAQMCTLSYGHRKNKSDCRGDSGGPFFCGFSIYGVISYGYKCGQWEVPNVYAKMSYTVEWFRSLQLKGLTVAGRQPDIEIPAVRSEKPRALNSSQALSARELLTIASLFLIASVGSL